MSLALYTLFVAAVPNADNAVRCGAGRFAAHSECCNWFDVLDDVQETLFEGRCDDEARESIRIQFHDAISYSKGLGSAGRYLHSLSVDGSILSHADLELTYAENTGLDNIVWAQRALAVKHGVSFGDFITFAGAVGLSNCHDAPRLRFFAGRQNSTAPAPDGLVPAPWHSVDRILARMADAGFSPEETIALLAAHSVATQHTIDPMADGAALDSTPESFDNRFFTEVCPGCQVVERLMNPHDRQMLLDSSERAPANDTVKGVVDSPFRDQLRLQSDYLMARDERTAPTWQSLSRDTSQMSSRFVEAMAKLSMLGQDPSTLVDCSDVIPQRDRN
ncbi:fungal class II heme-containing peroxidase [Phlebiopsis gigantea 11061_1 CR5-6]|uniref:Peroxidase n=1 Tax=Phlebiopsis gigantea (strain 11061_1 CR5-6) TaxID=745531 RepID=A0A0C3P9X8_PHLG1|nr:fungal class II heme-containing peroxidase [Phlebiopsis gigantea 11061_1 CR5-6]